jgi:hypothetical protein
VVAPTPGAKPPARGASPPAKKVPTVAGPILPEDTVLKRYPFTIKFTGSPRSIEDVMNHLATAKEQFHAVREIRVENEKKEGPQKGATTAASNEAVAKKKDSTVVLGGEKVTAWMAVDLLRFLPPGTAPAKSTANTNK